MRSGAFIGGFERQQAPGVILSSIRSPALSALARQEIERQEALYGPANEAPLISYRMDFVSDQYHIEVRYPLREAARRLAEESATWCDIEEVE